MDIEKLIRRLRNDADAYRNGETLGRAFADQEDVLDNAATALSALRPVSRERVEKVWRGEWKGVPKLGVYDMACSKCGYSTGIRFYSSEFCPNCGVPMTDEAVEMVMERMDALKDG